MGLTINLAPSYRDLKDPTSRQNFDGTPGQIPTLILTLRHIKKGCYSNTTLIFLDLVPKVPKGKSNSNSLGLA